MDNITIKEISLKELDEILKSQPNFSHGNGSKKLDKFEHIYDDTAYDRLHAFNQTRYAKFQKLKPFEKQKKKGKLDSDYDISIVAMRNNELVGIVSLKWFYDNFGDINLWNYRNRIISVKEKYQNQKIATQLLQKLECSRSIDGKVLRFGNFTKDGESYLKNIIPKIFTNKNYYILPKDDDKYGKPFPKNPGCYLFGDYD